LQINAANAVRYWARATPDAPAITFGDETLGYAALDRSSNRLANGLRGLGVERGDRVGILSSNCPEYCEVALATLKLGAIVVPLNVRLAEPELAYIAEHAGCRVVVAHHDLADRLAAMREAPGPQHVVIEGAAASPSGDALPLGALRSAIDADPDVAVAGHDPAFLCYTSGTTGQPKGAMLSHENVWSQSCHRILADDWTGQDRIYLPFPLAFTGGIISNWMPTYFAGAHIVLDAEFDAGRTLRTIERERISVLMAVPVIWETLVAHPGFADADLSSLRFASAGGAPVPETLLRALQARGIAMSQGYGLTEGSGMSTTLGSRDALRKLGCAGLPTMHTRVRVVDEQGEPCGAGEVGELCIHGPDVMLGYWNDPEATAETIRDGWLHTGDLAAIDDEGFVRIVDRAKDMLISGGLNVYPAEIERVLAGYPGLAEAAVIGVTDVRWGESAAAIVTLANDRSVLDEPALRAFCRERLADYKCPRHIVVRSEPLPRGMSGKILKRLLREQYGGLGSRGESA